MQERIIEYRVRQSTTAPDADKVIERFKAEVKLQFGSSIEIQAVSVTPAES